MKQRLGIFVAGFRWSGSGAVSDWMAGRAALRQAPNSEASFGEIRAINYGLRNSLLAAEGPRPFGERRAGIAIAHFGIQRIQAIFEIDKCPRRRRDRPRGRPPCRAPRYSPT